MGLAFLPWERLPSWVLGPIMVLIGAYFFVNAESLSWHQLEASMLAIAGVCTCLYDLRKLRARMLICSCARPPFHYSQFQRIELGTDRHGADVSVSKCRKCATAWLVYLIDEPQYTQSGRWWRVPLATDFSNGIPHETARAYIENQPWCFVGGSCFKSAGSKKIAPIKVR